jgi:hypothetical protein
MDYDKLNSPPRPRLSSRSTRVPAASSGGTCSAHMPPSEASECVKHTTWPFSGPSIARRLQGTGSRSTADEAMCEKEMRQPSERSHDYVCLNFGSNLAVAMSARNHGGSVVGCSFQLSRVSRLDFVAKRSALTISNGGLAR